MARHARRRAGRLRRCIRAECSLPRITGCRARGAVRTGGAPGRGSHRVCCGCRGCAPDAAADAIPTICGRGHTIAEVATEHWQECRACGCRSLPGARLTNCHSRGRRPWPCRRDDVGADLGQRQAGCGEQRFPQVWAVDCLLRCGPRRQDLGNLRLGQHRLYCGAGGRCLRYAHPLLWSSGWCQRCSGRGQGV